MPENDDMVFFGSLAEQWFALEILNVEYGETIE